MSFIIAFFYLGLTLLAIRTVPWGRGLLLHPGVMFTLFSTLYFIGTLTWIDSNNSVDTQYLIVLLIAHGCLVTGMWVAAEMRPVRTAATQLWYRKPLERIENNRTINQFILVLAIVSILVCLAYYRAVGYNLFLESAISLLSGSGVLANIADLRLNAYAGETYFAAGYVNQFKNTLFPLILIFLVGRYMALRSRRDGVISWLLLPLCLVFILGTGQRYYIAFITVVAVAFFQVAFPRVSRFSYAVLIGMTAVFLFVGTAILGRTTKDVSSSEGVVSIAGEIGQRVTSVEASGGVLGFQYIYSQDPAWGRDWVGRVVGILPGQGRSLTIDNELHALIHGSERGTVSLNVWGQAWYNFRILGAVIPPFLLGWICHSIFLKLVRGPKALLRVLIFAFLSVIIGSWQMGGPEYLINQGLVTVLILSCLVNWIAPYGKLAPALQPAVIRDSMQDVP